MEDNNKTVDQEAVIPGKENANHTDEGTEGQGTGSGVDVGNKEGEGEDSPYKKQLADYAKKLEDKDAIIENKNRALEAEKKRRKDLEGELNLDEREKRLKEDITRDFEFRQQETTFKQKLNAFTTDPDEQAAIELHYKNSIVKTGNLEKDLLNAMAIANQHIVVEQRQMAMAEEQRGQFTQQFTQTSIRGANKPFISDPIKREAAAFLEKINPKAIQHLK